MKTITIESEYESVFDVYGLELITACGVVQVSGVYVERSRAEEMAEYYQKRGWLNVDKNIRYKVYQVNLVALTAFV